MDICTAKIVIDDPTLSDDAISILIIRARKKAANHHFWGANDNPSEEELNCFYNRYEMEIYDLAKAINSSDSRDGLISYSELGVNRSWGKTGKETIEDALSAIPPKTYVF